MRIDVGPKIQTTKLVHLTSKGIIANTTKLPSPKRAQGSCESLTRNFIFSIKPNYAEEIMAGRKTVELRRRFSKVPVVGARVFIYCSSPAKEMIGYATISDVRCMPIDQIWKVYRSEARITRANFVHYFKGMNEGYVIALHAPQRLRESISMQSLKERFGFRAPQSYRYAGAEYHSLIK
jgi:predicted transcriptional regulator